MKTKLYYIGWGVVAVAAVIFARTDSEHFLRWVALGLVIIGAGLMLRAKNTN